jgi:protein phosphatase
MTLKLRAYGATHPGQVHLKNEDSFAVADTRDGGQLLVVCDGMGGMGRGDQASRLAIKEVLPAFDLAFGEPGERMIEVLHHVDRRIRDVLCAAGAVRGWAGSTAVMCYVANGSAHIGWIGDSRCYILRDGAVAARTKDHKLVQELIDNGQLTEEEARRSSLSSVITRALGGRPPEAPPVAGAALPPVKLVPGDRMLLCSDGLVDLAEDEELVPLIRIPRLEDAADALIKLANDRGGHDNITVIVAAWDETTAEPEALVRIGGAAAEPDLPPEESQSHAVRPVGRLETDPLPPPDPDDDADLEVRGSPLAAMQLLLIVALGVLAWLGVQLLHTVM